MTMLEDRDSSRVDKALLASVAAGHVPALTELYDRHAGTLLAVGVRVLRDRSDAEDALHDLFVDLPERARSYDGSRGTVIAWLVVAMRNRAIDRARRRAIRLVKDRKIEHEAAPLAAPQPEQELALARRRARVARVLAKLPNVQRSVLETVFFDGLSYPEIAARDGVALGTIKSRAARALATLRRLLAEEPESDLSTRVTRPVDTSRRARFSLAALVVAAMPR